MAIRINKGNASKVVTEKRLQRFLDSGWTTDEVKKPEPKLSAVLEATADVIEEELPLVEEDEDEESSMPTNEGED
jgi:hypothetical protein